MPALSGQEEKQQARAVREWIMEKPTQQNLSGLLNHACQPGKNEDATHSY